MIILNKVSVESRNEFGVPTSWRIKGQIAEFKTVSEFEEYIDEHIAELDDNVQPLSGSASVLQYCSQYLIKARMSTEVVCV